MIALPRNVTISITDELANEMKDYPEVNWSELCRQAIKNYIQDRKGLLTVRAQRRKEMVEYVAGRRLAILKEELIQHYCDKWSATPSEVELILEIARGAGDLSVGSVDRRTYIISDAWPHGKDAEELQKDQRLVHEVTLRRLRKERRHKV